MIKLYFKIKKIKIIFQTFIIKKYKIITINIKINIKTLR
jgi:hypothetical protein